MSFNFPSRTKGVFRFFYIQTLRLKQPPVMGKKPGVFSPGSKQMNRSVFSGYRAYKVVVLISYMGSYFVSEKLFCRWI